MDGWRIYRRELEPRRTPCAPNREAAQDTQSVKMLKGD